MTTISGSSSFISSLTSQSMRERQDPEEKFNSLDSDSNGSLDKTELSELAIELSKITSTTLDVDSAITTYDADQDGMLNSEEMDTMMNEIMEPPQGDGDTAVTGPPPPPPPQDPSELFTDLDEDDSDTLNVSELESFAEQVASMTGETFDVEDALKNYDADGDGELNQDEMNTMMEARMQEDGVAVQQQTDVNSSLLQQALTAYQNNSATTDQEALLSQLLNDLSNGQS